jgi:hypothetical protein
VALLASWPSLGQELPAAGDPGVGDAGFSLVDGGAEAVARQGPDAGPDIDAGPIAASDGGGDRGKVEATPPSPGFTQDRQFTNAALWLLDPGQYTVEQWWSGQWGQPQTLVGTNNQQNQLLQTGVAMGITPHVELDVYANVDLGLDGQNRYDISRTGLTGVEAALRVAIGRQWGQIWGNPVIEATLWGRVFEPTRVEGRFLLSGELVPGWLLDLNLMFARDGFHDDIIGVDYEAKAEFGMSGEVIPDILRLGFEANLGVDSHNAVDDNDYTLVFPSAQVGPMILLTEPHKRIKLLAAVLFGRTGWDPPWESQVMVSSSF